jgi:hypothetical protein
VYPSPYSSLYGLGYTPDYVVYHELVMTSKEYMQQVTAVDAQWLAEMGPMFFTIKESHNSSFDQKKKSSQTKTAMELEMTAYQVRSARIHRMNARWICAHGSLRLQWPRTHFLFCSKRAVTRGARTTNAGKERAGAATCRSGGYGTRCQRACEHRRAWKRSSSSRAGYAGSYATSLRAISGLSRRVHCELTAKGFREYIELENVIALGRMTAAKGTARQAVIT